MGQDRQGDVDVAIVGAGPAGMVLAAELVLGGVSPDRLAVLERRPDAVLVGSRAGGFHARTIELFDQRGVGQRFVDAGTTHPLPFTGSRMLRIDDLPTRRPFTLGLFQNRIEEILLEWVTSLGVEVRRSWELDSLDAADDAVTLGSTAGDRVRTRFVVGADGGRSVVRRLAGIAFPGVEATRTSLIAEARVREQLPPGVRHDERGTHGVGLMPDGVTARIVVGEGEVRRGDATPADLTAALTAVFGADFGVHDITWLSRFGDATRQAAAYRAGRVLLVGDAAHIHSPAGGQGIGLGVQDAMNLGWKLASVVRGHASEGLLDSYHDERHPAGARALQHTLAIGALQRTDPRSVALDALLGDLLEDDGARRRLVARHAGLDVVHDLGEGPGLAHPLVGRRVPDADLVVARGVGGVGVIDGTVHELLHAARPLVLSLAPDVVPEGLVSPWGDRVRVVTASIPASAEGEWDVPVLGPVAVPGALLVRPDGHVAWAADDADGLASALTRWCGPAS